MVGVVHTEETNRHSRSVKYQSLLKKHIAETPLFAKTEISVTSSMDDLTPLFSDTY